MGILLGPRGANVQDIRAKAGPTTFISALPPSMPGGPQVVRITGENRHMAAAMVREKVDLLQRTNAELVANRLDSWLSHDVAVLAQAQALLRGLPVASLLPQKMLARDTLGCAPSVWPPRATQPHPAPAAERVPLSLDQSCQPFLLGTSPQHLQRLASVQSHPEGQPLQQLQSLPGPETLPSLAVAPPNPSGLALPGGVPPLAQFSSEQ